MAHVTVPDEAPRAQFAVGGSSTGPFNFDFTFYANADLKVYVGDNTVPLTLTTDYTVVGAPGTTGGYEGGALTLVAAVEDTTVTIELDITITRTTDFPTVGAFNITSLNTQLDKMFSILRQIDEKYSRALHLPPVDGDLSMVIVPDADRDNTIFVWDADSEPAVKTYAEMAVLIGSTTAADNATGLAAKVAAELAETHAETAETNAEASEVAAATSAAAAAASLSSANLPVAVASTLLIRNAGNTAYEAKTYAQTKTLLGATATGDAVFVAANAAAGLSALSGQPIDATLTALAGLTGASDKIPYFNGADAAALADFTATGRSIVAAANAAAALTVVGGQPIDAMLTAIAALVSADNKMLAFSGADTPALIDMLRTSAAWTPGISSSGGAVTATGASPLGRVWKIGELVIAHFRYYAASIAGGSGDLRITGLPYTVVNSASTINAWGFVSQTENINTGAGPVSLGLHADENTTFVLLRESFDNAASAFTQITAWSASARLSGSLIYRAAP